MYQSVLHRQYSKQTNEVATYIYYHSSKKSKTIKWVKKWMKVVHENESIYTGESFEHASGEFTGN